MAETYTAYTIYYFDQAYFEDDFEERNNTTKTPFETEEESYQTASVFDLLLSESDSSTQTVTPEPMEKETIPHYHYLELLQPTSSPATWFSQETDANAQHRIIRWTPTNTGEKNTSFTIQFKTKFRIPILIFKWCMKLERRTQGSGKVVTEYAKVIRKLIKHIDSGKNWTEEQKIHSFTKELRTDLSYALWPLLALKNNPTIDMAIKLAQRIEDNQKMYLGSTLPVFAPASAMALASQMAAASFAAQTQNPNKQLIDRLTANLVQLLESLT
ncbi:hypothetical protein G9A89_018661 [Geosiphon pyriformis]|nr:hypothetical protein G9A89_018661 [Geosiphon pyriformis]